MSRISDFSLLLSNVKVRGSILVPEAGYPDSLP